MATIKAGTYRFHDVLSAPTQNITQEITYTVTTSGQTFTGGAINVGYADNRAHLMYGVDAAFSDGERLIVCENSDWSYFVEEYGEGIQTITIPEDTDVSDEFGAWFAENAKPCISGVWKLNDSLVFSQGDIEESVNVSVNLTYEGTKCVVFLDAIHVDADAEEVSGHSYRVEPETDGIGEGVGFGYFNGSWDWETWGDVVNVFDFGTEPQPVSAEFYEWLTANAVQPVATVTYNGAVIANLFDGQTATLKCKGKKMESDIVVVLA